MNRQRLTQLRERLDELKVLRISMEQDKKEFPAIVEVSLKALDFELEKVGREIRKEFEPSF